MSTHTTIPADPQAGRLPAALNLNLILADRFNLRSDMIPEEETTEAITRGTDISGTNLWLLIAAMLIASIGLNVNSTAVIIGAMLISPLMGPILGAALGIATYDFPLIRSALKSLFFAVSASVLASTFYFLLTPLGDAQSELLARIQPSFFDVLIAAIGGIAGMIGMSRKQPGNILTGVAIATALMPPLCTAGYGLATQQPQFFFGAFYLFFINSVFICLGAIAVLKYLRFKPHLDPRQPAALRLKQAILLITLVTLTPSLYLTYGIIQETFFRSSVKSFLTKEVAELSVPVLSHAAHYSKEEPRIELTYLGSGLTPEMQKRLQASLPSYGLRTTKLVFRANALSEPAENLEALRNGLLDELYKKSEGAIRERDQQIEALKVQLATQLGSLDLHELGPELKTQLSGLKGFTLAKAPRFEASGEQQGKGLVLVGSIQTQGPVRASDRKRVLEWLKVRTKAAAVKVSFVEGSGEF